MMFSLSYSFHAIRYKHGHSMIILTWSFLWTFFAFTSCALIMIKWEQWVGKHNSCNIALLQQLKISQEAAHLKTLNLSSCVVFDKNPVSKNVFKPNNKNLYKKPVFKRCRGQVGPCPTFMRLQPKQSWGQILFLQSHQSWFGQSGEIKSYFAITWFCQK